MPSSKNLDPATLLALAVERRILSEQEAEAVRPSLASAPSPLLWLQERSMITEEQARDLEHGVLLLLRTRSLEAESTEEALPREFGPYTLLSVIGRGGMGMVYRAEQKSLGRAVAVKIMAADPASAAADRVARFQQEGRIMAQLAHPDIVPIHDYGLHEGVLYLAMDLVPGIPLDRYYRTYFPGAKQVAAIAARMARALAYAHSLGIVHRDIKPGNILIDAQGNPKLTDFGLAKIADAKLTVTGSLLGTPMYMSPEQAAGSGAEVDARTDVYSLGAVLYEGLTGRPPFSGTTIESIIRKVASEDPSPPRAIARQTPLDLETVCLKALSKHRDRRYAGAMEFAEDLERFVRGEPVAARRPGLAARGWRKLREHRWLSIGAAVLCVIAAGGVAVSLFLLRELTRQKARQETEERIQRANRLFDAREYAGALSLLPPDRSDAAFRRAVCLAALERWSEGNAAIRSYLADHPADAAAWRIAGLIALERGDIPTAVRAYRETVRLNPIPGCREAERNGDHDALIALVEGHSLAKGVHLPRPLWAEYDPTYLFYDMPLPPPPYGLSRTWKETFPPRTLAPLSKEDLAPWSSKHGRHPVLLGWHHRASAPSPSTADLDSALARVPHFRWLRCRRYLLYRSLGRIAEAARERETLRTLCPTDPAIRLLIALRLKEEGALRLASREFESLYEDARKGVLPQTWLGTGRKTPHELLLLAAGSAALSKNAKETLRLLRRGKDLLRRSDVRSHPDFRSVLDDGALRTFLETLRP